MSTTYGQFISEIRGRIWPPGNAEADNLVASHNKDFIDALVDLQTVVLCLQQDNTDIYPQCSTTYKCGLTVIPAPRGIIRKLSVIDKIDPTTHLESATAADDYCSEIAYSEIDFCHINRYLAMSHKNGWCPNLGLWFGLGCCDFSPWFGTFHRNYPTPTDEGVPAGLPPLPLGFHYPQTSTDSTRRAYHGVWAKDRGNIYLAPWIQSTESILLKWDGIKRKWNPGDPIDDDPLLSRAVEAYVRWQHAKKWDKDEQAAAEALADYRDAVVWLVHQCREETRIRGCEPSLARASTIGLASLYYNDEQSYVARCPTGQTGNPVSVTIQSGTVGSNKSVDDANQKALAQARTQAEAQIVCTAAPTVYASSRDWSFTASCAVEGVQEAAAPVPTGPNNTATVKAGTVFPTATSQAGADAQAQALAEERATAGLKCVYGNAAQTATKACADGVTGLVTVTVPAGTKSVTSNGGGDQASAQAAADMLAKTEAQNQANEQYLANNVDCGGSEGPPGTTVYWNTQVKTARAQAPCRVGASGIGSLASVIVTVPIHSVNGTSELNANQQAQITAQNWAAMILQNMQAQQPPMCGVTLNVTYPDFPHFTGQGVAP